MEKDYSLIQGQSKTWNLKFTINGTAIDITGYMIFATVKSRIDMSDADAEVKKDITPSNPATGECSVTFTATDTANLKGQYYYDIKFVTSSGLSQYIYIGKLTFDKCVSIRTT